MKSRPPFKQSALLLVLTAVFFVACSKQETAPQPEEPPSPEQKCECENEQAFRDVPGEPVYLKDNNGKVMITLVKKKDNYILGGDVVLSEEQVGLLRSQINNASGGRTGTSQIIKFWPNRTVYYTIDPSLPNPSRVTEAIAHWQTQTNLTFVQRTNQANYVEFFAGDGCYSGAIGMTGGRQVISLGSTCTTGNAIHEIGHAVGFFHEQMRADRDSYIVVHSNNINPDYLDQFSTFVQLEELGFHIGTFDFGSIMLYPSHNSFSSNGQPTMTRLDGSTFDAQRTGLSAGDIETYNYMYNRPGFAIERTNFDYISGNDWFEYIYDVAVVVFTDNTFTVPLTLTTPWVIRVKKTRTVSTSPTPVVEHYTITLPAGTSRWPLGQDHYRVQYGGGTNFVYEASWSVDSIIPSKP